MTIDEARELKPGERLVTWIERYDLDGNFEELPIQLVFDQLTPTGYLRCHIAGEEDLPVDADPAECYVGGVVEIAAKLDE
jgi:hypothetical protein